MAFDDSEFANKDGNEVVLNNQYLTPTDVSVSVSNHYYQSPITTASPTSTTRSIPWLFGIFVAITAIFLGFAIADIAFAVSGCRWCGVLLVAAYIPMVVFMTAFYCACNRSSVDANHVGFFFFVGIGGYIAAMIGETILVVFSSVFFSLLALSDSSVTLQLLIAFFNSFIMAALVEETIKYIMATLALVSIRSWMRPTPWGVMILSLAATLTMATVENLSYVLFAIFSNDSPWKEALQAVIIRNLISVPLHTYSGISIGCDMAQLREKHPTIGSEIISKAPLILWHPIILHGLFDFSLMSSGVIPVRPSYGWIFIAIPIAIVLIGWTIVGFKIRSLRQLQHQQSPVVGVALEVVVAGSESELNF